MVIAETGISEATYVLREQALRDEFRKPEQRLRINLGATERHHRPVHRYTAWSTPHRGRMASPPFMVKAFELAPASRIAPFGYVDIVAATALGYLVFDDFPDAWALLGIGIIVAAGALLSYRAPSEAM